MTISKTRFDDNHVNGRGHGGALSVVVQSPETATVKLTDTTFDDNSAIGRGGAVNVLGTRPSSRPPESPCGATRAQGFGGALFTQADSTIKESLFDGNTIDAADATSSTQGGGIYSNSGNQAEPNKMRIVGTSVTNNQATGGDNQQGAGIWTTGIDLKLLNSTSARTKRSIPARVAVASSSIRTRASRARRPAVR